MKYVRIILPIIINMIVTFFYKYLAESFLEEWMEFDFIMYIDGREEYQFGIGSLSICVVLILFLLSMIAVTGNKKRLNSKKNGVAYQIVGIISLIIIDGIWLLHYVDWYLYPLCWLIE